MCSHSIVVRSGTALEPLQGCHFQSSTTPRFLVFCPLSTPPPPPPTLVPAFTRPFSFGNRRTEWVVSQCCSAKVTQLLLGSHGLSQAVKRTQATNPTLRTQHRIRLPAAPLLGGGAALELLATNAISSTPASARSSYKFTVVEQPSVAGTWLQHGSSLGWFRSPNHAQTNPGDPVGHVRGDGRVEYFEREGSVQPDT